MTLSSVFQNIKNYFAKESPIENLAIFRILYGILISAECFGALLTGWVNKMFVASQFNVPFIGFEWLAQLLHGPISLYLYFIMGCLGILISLGYQYRKACFTLAMLWFAFYLSQKTHYNNHYYLLVWLNFLMLIVPAAHALSIDVKLGRKTQYSHIPSLYYYFFISLFWIVYSFAALHKIYPDWLAALPIQKWFVSKSDYPIIGNILQERWLQYAISWGGIAFDGLIIPALLWRKSRPFAIIISFVFHIFNSVIFQIGSFPYLMLAAIVFFVPSEFWQKHFFKNRLNAKTLLLSNTKKNVLTVFFLVFLLFHISFPIRNVFFKGSVFYTEEGHRMSWRMMLRSKRGNLTYKVVHINDGKIERVKLSKWLAYHQSSAVSTSPDMIWQMAQFIHHQYQTKGLDVQVFAECSVKLNQREYQVLIDPKVDLAKAEYRHLKHNDWIFPLELNSIPQKTISH